MFVGAEEGVAALKSAARIVSDSPGGGNAGQKPATVGKDVPVVGTNPNPNPFLAGKSPPKGVRINSSGGGVGRVGRCSLDSLSAVERENSLPTYLSTRPLSSGTALYCTVPYCIALYFQRGRLRLL